MNINDERQHAMYGMGEADALADWHEYLRANELLGERGRDMAITSALSDAQELLAMGRYEEARQLLNRVKLGIWQDAAV